MNPTKLAASAALAVAVPGLILGLLLLLSPVDLLIGIIFVIMGIVTVFSSIPGLVVGLSAFSTAGGKVSLIASLISIVVGFLMIFYHNELLMIILGVYMIVLPLINILLSRERVKQCKAELPKIVIGLLLVLLGPANTLDLLFRVVGWVAIALSIGYAVFVFLSVRKKTAVPVTPTGKIYVDFDGDGTVDGVDVDGDGTVDAVFAEQAENTQNDQ